jgi:hypothetical protein
VTLDGLAANEPIVGVPVVLLVTVSVVDATVLLLPLLSVATA